MYDSLIRGHLARERWYLQDLFVLASRLSACAGPRGCITDGLQVDYTVPCASQPLHVLIRSDVSSMLHDAGLLQVSGEPLFFTASSWVGYQNVYVREVFGTCKDESPSIC